MQWWCIACVNWCKKNIRRDKSQFYFKDVKIAEPSSYLGSTLQKTKAGNYVCWTITSVECNEAAIETVDTAIKETSSKFPNKVTTLMVTTCSWIRWYIRARCWRCTILPRIDWNALMDNRSREGGCIIRNAFVITVPSFDKRGTFRANS